MQFTIDNAPHVMSRVASGAPQNSKGAGPSLVALSVSALDVPASGAFVCDSHAWTRPGPAAMHRVGRFWQVLRRFCHQLRPSKPRLVELRLGLIERRRMAVRVHRPARHSGSPPWPLSSKGPGYSLDIASSSCGLVPSIGNECANGISKRKPDRECKYDFYKRCHCAVT